MAETIDVPALGTIPKKYVVIGGSVAAGIVAYAWWNAGRGTAEEEPLPVDVGDTGIPTDGYVNPAPGGSSTSGGEIDPSTLPPTTNDEWMRRAVAALEGIGYDPRTVADVLGRYLGRQYVTTAQADIIRTALAFVGPVPVGNFSILLEPIGPVTPTRPPVVDPPVVTPPVVTPPPTSGGTPPYIVHTAKSGETLSGIAAKYGKSWQQVWDFNLRYRSAATQAVLRARGPNKFFAGSTFWIPK